MQKNIFSVMQSVMHFIAHFIKFADALMSGYQSVRPLSEAEQAYLPLAQQAACIRFWVSRLLDFHFPPEGELTFTKNPDVFRDLLLKLQQDQQ